MSRIFTMHYFQIVSLVFVWIANRKTSAREQNLFDEFSVSSFDAFLPENANDDIFFDLPVDEEVSSVDYFTSTTVGSSLFDNTQFLSDSNPSDDSCYSNDYLQPLSRIRARSSSGGGGEFCDPNQPPFQPPMIEFKPPASPIPQDLTTQEDMSKHFCPTKNFQGVLNIAVCVLSEESVRPVDAVIYEVPEWMLEPELRNLVDALLGTSVYFSLSFCRLSFNRGHLGPKAKKERGKKAFSDQLSANS